MYEEESQIERVEEWSRVEMKKRGVGRLHNLIMSVGILTPFDDLVRSEDRGGDVFSSPSMTPFQSSSHTALSLLSP